MDTGICVNCERAIPLPDLTLVSGDFFCWPCYPDGQTFICPGCDGETRNKDRRDGLCPACRQAT